MANKKITALPELTSPAGADLLAIVDDVDGTPTTKQVTATNLMGLAPVQSVAGQTGTVTLSNTDISGLGTAATTDSTDYATAAQGAKADSATQPGDLGTSAALDVGTSANNVVQLNGSAQLPAVDGSNLTGISTAVEGTAVLSTGETGGVKFLREDGDGTCSFQEATADVETPLNTALRGTDNPHIGAYPNQSLRVIDNPSKSVAVISDTDGNLDFMVKTDSSRAYLNTPSGRLELTTGVSVVEDSTEPDIEITTTSGTYSLISGDSDALGSNGLPLQQGFNHPDIGAYPAPILISGGSIA